MNAVLAVLAGALVPTRDPATGVVRMAPARLSRRDRAALTLALECVRAGDDGEDTGHALDCAGGGLSASVLRALQYADKVDCDPLGRVIRARLALLLRLVLRCDAATREEPGAYPPPAWRLTYWLRDQSTTVLVQSWLRLEDDNEYDPRDSIERIVPLWCQAPATRPR